MTCSNSFLPNYTEYSKLISLRWTTCQSDSDTQSSTHDMIYINIINTFLINFSKAALEVVLSVTEY